MGHPKKPPVAPKRPRMLTYRGYVPIQSWRLEDSWYGPRIRPYRKNFLLASVQQTFHGMRASTRYARIKWTWNELLAHVGEFDTLEEAIDAVPSQLWDGHGDVIKFYAIFDRDGVEQWWQRPIWPSAFDFARKRVPPSNEPEQAA